jgi:hypothetical protein
MISMLKSVKYSMGRNDPSLHERYFFAVVFKG